MRPALVLIALLITLIAGPGFSLRAAEITLTPIGTPTWQPVDFHVFAAPIGTVATGYAEFGATMEALMPSPNHISHPVVGRMPGAPHAGPYDTEMGMAITSLGLTDKTVFSAREFSNGTGVYLVYMIVPGPGSPTGSTNDYASGPIIPNTLQPIHSHYSVFRDGALWKPAEDYFTIPNPGFDGYSHIPNFFANNFDFAGDPSAGVLGSYEYRIELTDAAGNGWTVSAPFQVVPEPGSLVLMGLGLGGLAAYRQMRRRNV